MLRWVKVKSVPVLLIFALRFLGEGGIDEMAEFHDMDPDLLQKALAILVKRGKAQVFGQESEQGVKFF